MEVVSDLELSEVKGGGISWWGICGIIAAGVFIVGIFDGISRPVKCG